MIDHLIKCVDAADYDAALTAYGLHEGNSHRALVYQITGTATDPEGTSVDVRAYLPYVYVWASLPHLDPAIASDPRCMIITDSEAFALSEDFILYVVPALVPDLMSYFIEPVRMTSNYPFG